MLVREMHDTLVEGLSPERVEGQTQPSAGHLLSFEACEEITCRLSWCRQSAQLSVAEIQGGLATVEEQDESASQKKDTKDYASVVQIPLSSRGGPPHTVKVPFQRLSEPCERTFMAREYSRASFDDEEMPLPELVYNHLLSLPIDARASCMSRIIFTGGCANIPGLKRRVFDEVSHIVQNRGWDPVLGRGADRARARVNRGQSASSVNGIAQKSSDGGETSNLAKHSSTGDAEPTQGTDPIDRMLRRNDRDDESVCGKLRAIESLGSWAGASLALQLRNMAVASIERDVWLQQGAQGASKASDVDMKAQQRQSLGPGLIRSTSASANWTLGAWGAM